MDAEVKQRNRRRKRAQRMQQAAQRESKVASKDGDSAEEDSESTARREKPLRPPIRRKKTKEPLVEEDIIDGFSVLGFKTYEDLESILKLTLKDVKRFLEEKPPRHETRPHITHHISAHPTTPVHGLTLPHQDPATSDDSGRASERLTGSSVAPRDADSSRDRLSDASSRCSSGKGYICDSEGEDDKGSDASSVIFGSTPTSRKHEFPGALPPSLPLSNGTSNSPVPAPTPPNLPTPVPAPAQLPPPHPITATKTGAITTGPIVTAAAPISSNVPPSGAVTMPCSTTVPMSIPQPAAAPVAHHPPAFVATTNHGRIESPAVAASAIAAVAPNGNGAAGGQYHHNPLYQHQPLYAPYAVHNTYSSQSPTASVTVTTTTVPVCQQPVTTVATALPTIVTSHRDSIITRTASPKGHSPTRERESYSSNVSSLSRSSVVTPISCPPPTTVSSSLSLNKNWSGSTPQVSPAPPRPTPPLHSSFSSSMFTAPLPPVSSASPLTPAVPPPPAPNPNPFSAESLFQTSNQADMLRRELDNRFLASQDRNLNLGPPPYLRAEMHQHQHHHTHVHQHTTSIIPPPPPSSSSIFPTPLFKDIPKLGSMDSSFYRQNIGLPGYPGYTPSMLHPGLTGPTPFMPPNHLQTFQPKPTPQPDPTKPKITKSGKWNAMHVRIAWEVYHHQQKEAKGTTIKQDLLRTPSHLFPPAPTSFTRTHELNFPPTLGGHRPPTFDQPHHGIYSSAAPHLSSAMSPFARYAAGYPAGSAPYGVSPLVSRDMPLGPLHDPWRGLQRTISVFPPSVNGLPPTIGGLPPPAPWTLKPDPILEQREREERERIERERERLRREREERERREREEKQRKLEQQQQQERERERREKERREMERREVERQQQERERLLHQQRLAESVKQLPLPMMRDRSPLRNGPIDPNEIRIKEEPRIKEEERYHPYMRQHPILQHSLPPMMDRSRVLPPPYPPAPPTHWAPTPADHYYRAYEPLRYNPLVDAAMRVEEERAKLFGAYPPPPHPAQYRPKDPTLLHLRTGSGPGPPHPTHNICSTPPTDLLKKEEPR